MPSSNSLKGNPDVDGWLSFDVDGALTVRSGKVDIGQRISAAVALVAAEELDIGLDRVRVAQRATDEVPDEGYSSGSRSMPDSAEAVRLAAATARRHLLGLAARRLDSAADKLDVEDGVIRARDTNRTVTYWELTGGRPLNLAIDEQAPIKAPEAHRLLGRVHEAPGLAGLTTGATRFVHDMSVPGMLHGRVVRPPHPHARLAGLDIDPARDLRDGQLVQDGSFLAVVHADEWTALQLAERVATAARWSPERGLDASDIGDKLLGNPRNSRPVIDGAAVEQPVPPPLAVPPNAVTTLSARFHWPYHMHASIGPSAALAHLDGGRLTVWTHSQGIFPLRETLAEALGRAKDSVHLIHAPGAGCYGHNGADDAAFDAALIACALPGRPVLLKWTRADEHGWEPYGSAMVADLSASLDKDGRIVAWTHETFSGSHGSRPRAGPNRIGPARLLASRWREPALAPPRSKPSLGFHSGQHRNQDPIYDIPARRIVKHLVDDLPLRTSSFRGLGALLNVLAIESLMDELARAAGADPAAFRLRHLTDPRARRLIESVADRLGAPGRGDGRGRGLGFARYKNSHAYAAVGIELGVDDDARVRLHRAVIAADAGEIVDRQGLISQIEGAMLQAASMTLYEAVTYDAFGVTSRDWESYPILRFDNVPSVDTMLMASPGTPFLGTGEATTGPAAAAIANAIFDATGLRLRRLPFTPEAIRAAALA